MSKVSVNEFKNWLDGVLDFQPDDWVPDAEQWEKILNKINQLDDTEKQVTVSQPMPEKQPPAQGLGQQQPKTRNPRPQGPLSVNPEEKVALPDIKPKKKHVEVRRQAAPQVDESGRVQTGDVHVMGDINTRDEEYESTFI
jgi:hypothetical protein